MMTRRDFVKRAAIPAVAILGVTAADLAFTPGAPATVHQEAGDSVPRRLRMLVQNLIPNTLGIVDAASIHSASGAISPGATGEAKANANKNVNGHVTYANNLDAAQATCSVTLHFQYTYNPDKYLCKDQQFSFVTNKGTCKIQSTAPCGSSGNCDCPFAVSEN
jgi:hypothetical protein